jgi:hypothetical protein
LVQHHSAGLKKEEIHGKPGDSICRDCGHRLLNRGRWLKSTDARSGHTAVLKHGVTS